MADDSTNFRVTMAKMEHMVQFQLKIHVGPSKFLYQKHWSTPTPSAFCCTIVNKNTMESFHIKIWIYECLKLSCKLPVTFLQQ